MKCSSKWDSLSLLTFIPGCKDEGVCLDELSLAVESDVGIVSVVVQLSHLGHELGAVKTHVEGFSWALKCWVKVFLKEGINSTQILITDVAIIS